MRTSRTIQRIAYDLWVRLLGLLLVVAACNPPGLTLEVVIDDPAMAKVELFAGRDCGECPRATAPPGLPLMPVDAGYIVDDPEPFTVNQNDFSDGVAGFRIQADQDQTLGILVALAYDAQGNIRWSWTGHGVDIPNGDSAHWRIVMSPTKPIDTNVGVANTERIAEWPHPKGHPSCLLLEHWDDSAHAKREMLSPKDDFDCDNVDPMIECEPFIPNAMGVAPNLDSANCVTPVADPAGTICMVGGPTCTENVSAPRDLCVPLDKPYCAPSTLCQCAGTPDEPACIRNLMVTGTNDVPTMPFMKCVIAVDASGNRCDPNTELFLDASEFLGTFSTNVCKLLALNDPEAPLGSFGNALRVGDAAKLRFENFAEPCFTEVVWEGSQPAPHLQFGFLEAEISNGYHLVVPVRIEVRLGCVLGGSVCGLSTFSDNTSETIYKCAGAQSITPACGPDPDHVCAGPWCNGQCCGKGESCGQNGCSCGGGSPCSGTDTCETGVINEDQCGSVCCGPGNPCPL